MKITEINLQPQNEEGNRVIELAKMEGDFNIVNPFFCAYKSKMDRKRESYIFLVENNDGKAKYVFALKNSEYETAKKLIPTLD